MPQVDIRPYEARDEESVLGLLADSLGKVVDDRYRAFFRWKHLDNPFGRSFMWVAEVDGELAGFRAFLRWRFVDPGGEPVEAARAVDTATGLRFRGLGIFRELTMHGLDEMRPQGIEFVFNTPNDQSRPGYLKMGWTVEGRVPVQMRARSLGALVRLWSSRTPAETWSRPAKVGEPLAGLGDVLEHEQPRVHGDRLVTDRSAPFLAWRFAGFAPVASRAVRSGSGAVLVRFRNRGKAIECTVGDVIGGVDRAEAGSAVRAAIRGGQADYAIAGGATPLRGLMPVPRLGPIQTRRVVAGAANRLPLALTLGDVEMF